MPVVGDALTFKAVFYDLDGAIRTDVTVAAAVRKPDGTAISPTPAVAQIGNWYQAGVTGGQNDAAGEWVATFAAQDDGDVTPLNAVISLDVSAASGSASDLFTADPTDFDGDAASFAARFLALAASNAQLGAGDLEYTGPVSPAGRVTLYQGADYQAVDGTALTWRSNSSVDLTGAAAALDVNGSSYAGVISGSAGDWTISVNLTRVQTAAIPIGVYSYAIQAALANGDLPPPLAVGTLIVSG